MDSHLISTEPLHSNYPNSHGVYYTHAPNNDYGDHGNIYPSSVPSNNQEYNPVKLKPTGEDSYHRYLSENKDYSQSYTYNNYINPYEKDNVSANQNSKLDETDLNGILPSTEHHSKSKQFYPAYARHEDGDHFHNDQPKSVNSSSHPALDLSKNSNTLSDNFHRGNPSNNDSFNSKLYACHSYNTSSYVPVNPDNSHLMQWHGIRTDKHDNTPSEHQHGSFPYSVNADSSSLKKEAKANRIKRPLNSFMLWAQSRRPLLVEKNPTMHFTEISKILGLEWNGMLDDEKQPFLVEAKRLFTQWKEDNPDYQRPATKKRPRSIKKIKPSPMPVDAQMMPGNYWNNTHVDTSHNILYNTSNMGLNDARN